MLDLNNVDQGLSQLFQDDGVDTLDGTQIVASQTSLSQTLPPSARREQSTLTFASCFAPRNSGSSRSPGETVDVEEEDAIESFSERRKPATALAPAWPSAQTNTATVASSSTTNSMRAEDMKPTGERHYAGGHEDEAIMDFSQSEFSQSAYTRQYLKPSDASYVPPSPPTSSKTSLPPSSGAQYETTSVPVSQAAMDVGVGAHRLPRISLPPNQFGTGVNNDTAVGPSGNNLDNLAVTRITGDDVEMEDAKATPNEGKEEDVIECDCELDQECESRPYQSPRK